MAVVVVTATREVVMATVAVAKVGTEMKAGAAAAGVAAAMALAVGPLKHYRTRGRTYPLSSPRRTRLGTTGRCQSRSRRVFRHQCGLSSRIAR